METISNVASAASRTLFGQGDDTKRESGTEPVSGLTGAGKPDDPYDGGNRQDSGLGGAAGSNAQPVFGSSREDTADNGSHQRTQHDYSNTGSYQDTPSNEGYHGATDQGTDHSVYNQNEYTTGTAYEPSSLAGSDRDASTVGGASSSTYTADDRASLTHANTYSERLPHQYTASSAGLSDPSRQNPDYNRDTFSTTPEYTSQRALGQYDTPTGPSGGLAQDGVPQGRNLTGSVERPEQETERTGMTSLHPDPKATVTHPTSSNADSTGGHVGLMRGAISGFSAVEPSVGADPSSAQQPTPKHQGADRPHEEPGHESLEAIRNEKAATERTQRSGGQAGGPRDPPSESKGTGQHWVKSTGTAAEGGDFDAAKPGAGRECDRLLEQRGVHRTAQPGKPSEGLPGDPTAKHGHGHGHGVAEKLKEKLHVPHHGHH